MTPKDIIIRDLEERIEFAEKNIRDLWKAIYQMTGIQEGHTTAMESLTEIVRYHVNKELSNEEKDT